MFEGPWLPGSFTKNFGWGRDKGLRALYDHIRIGFGELLEPVDRETYTARVSHLPRSELIALNFFLFNKIEDGRNILPVDELVFQALTAPHSARFDSLALFALNLSMVGVWKGAQAGQRYPALWARNYILRRVAAHFNWNVAEVSTGDIEAFLRLSPEFRAMSSHHKMATNLSWLYRVGHLENLSSPRIERWWVDAAFLTLDRLQLDAKLNGVELNAGGLSQALFKSGFLELSGPNTSEKSFAIAHITALHNIAGGLARFDPNSVMERIGVLIPNFEHVTPNDSRPQGAVHRTNPRLLKTIPRNCAPLAQRVGYDIVFADDLETFNPEDYAAKQTASALARVLDSAIQPSLSAEELHKITRGE